MPVIVDDRWVWVYDVALAVLLAEIVGIAQMRAAHEPNLPDDKLHDFRVLAFVGNLACAIDADWNAAERDLLVEFIESACERLAARKVISEQDGRCWRILDEQTIVWRGGPEETGPIVEFGEAFVRLLRGTRPPDPTPRQWFYGFAGGRHAAAALGSAGNQKRDLLPIRGQSKLHSHFGQLHRCAVDENPRGSGV